MVWMLWYFTYIYIMFYMIATATACLIDKLTRHGQTDRCDALIESRSEPNVTMLKRALS